MAKTNLPTSGYLNNASRTNAEMKQALEDLRQQAEQCPGFAESGFSSAEDLTISSGSITPVQGIHNVLPESGTTDDLDTIAMTNCVYGQLLILCNLNATNVITIKHNTSGAGHIRLYGSADVKLRQNEFMMFRCDDETGDTYWTEVAWRRGTVQVDKIEVVNSSGAVVLTIDENGVN